MKSFIAILTAAFAIVALLPSQADAHHRHHYRHHHHLRMDRIDLKMAQGCHFDNDGHTSCFGSEYRTSNRPTRTSYSEPNHHSRVDANGNGVVFIPNPSGTWRINRSCAHRLAAYWGLGRDPDLDLVANWPKRYAVVGGPGIGIAWVRGDRGHIMGIIGGGPGGWRVADFNSGNHLNREYTVTNFHGGLFLDPRVRVASR